MRSQEICRIIWIAFKIWISALLANCVVGSAIITRFFALREMLLGVFLFGLIVGALFSFPVFMLLFAIIKWAVAKKISGQHIFLYVVTYGILSTTIIFSVFHYWINTGEQYVQLFGCALASALFGICMQYQPILRLTQPGAILQNSFETTIEQSINQNE